MKCAGNFLIGLMPLAGNQDHICRAGSGYGTVNGQPAIRLINCRRYSNPDFFDNCQRRLTTRVVTGQQNMIGAACSGLAHQGAFAVIAIPAAPKHTVQLAPAGIGLLAQGEQAFSSASGECA